MRFTALALVISACCPAAAVADDEVSESGRTCSPGDISTSGTCNMVPDGITDLSDFSCYLTLWGNGDPRADVTTYGTSNGVPDGAVTLSDFAVFLEWWGEGCP